MSLRTSKHSSGSRVERVERGNMQNDPKPTPVCPIIEEILKELFPDLAAKKQSVSLASCVNETASVDPEILRGILRELLHNASVYSPARTRIAVSATKRRKHIVLSVSDTGCGIPASERHRIFEKFGRASNAHLHNPDGSGLGLYIIRNILEAVGGKIWMESEEGKGTTVTFTVPAA
jgi:signal transduction histidine kinase